MCKSIIISLLAGVIISDLSCFEIQDSEAKILVILGIAMAVFIFCLFCEEMYEKWHKRRKRVLKTQETVRKLRFSGRKEEP